MMKKQSKLLFSILLMIVLLCTTVSAATVTTQRETIPSTTKKLTMVKGEKLYLSIKGYSGSVSWKSSKSSVLSVGSKNLLTAKKKGTATLTGTIKNKKISLKVTVQAPKISASSVTLTVGKKKQLKVTGTSFTPTWKTSNKNIATVTNKGIITAKKAGTANITAIVKGVRFTCKVRVKAKTPTPTPTHDDGGDDDPDPPSSSLEIHFIDVGQADATLITCNKEAMLIDAGGNSTGTFLQSYLMKSGVSTLKYAIGTHPHEDHIGGLDVIITKFDVGTLLMPPVSLDTRTYDDVIQAAKYKTLKITNPIAGATYSLGTAKFQIIGPVKNYGDNINNWSIGIRLVHGNNSFLFCGDAEQDAEQDILRSYSIRSNVYKVNHHGSATSSSEAFLNAVSPEYAVISCGKGNEYGHPHTTTLNRLKQKGIKTFRTDEQGSIVLKSDGKKIQWSTIPSTTWTPGQTANSSTAVLEYVLNTRSMIYHKPDCSSVAQMSEKNKKVVVDSAANLEQQGYRACGNCGKK